MKKILVTEKQYDKLMNESVNDIYFKTFSEAVQKARESAELKGYVINEDDWWNQVTTGPGRPKEDKTTRMDIGLYKNGKPIKKMLHIQIYNRGNDFEYSYELNFYIS